MLDSGGNQLSDTDLVIYYANEAVIRGARVVNISLGSNTAKSGPHTLGQDSARFSYGHVFREAVQGANHPLWVLSAGNMGHGTDSYWQSSLGIADSLSTESIIVTGAHFQRGLLSDDATGAGKIDIAAPGQSVSVMDGAGVSTASGSSFATPLVSGAAGLLFAFDSTLTASEVKQLILAGASTHLAVGTIPFLDAYEALKLAARRAGAPLCGNRVHSTANGDVMAERVGSPDEKLFTSIDGQPYTDLLNVLHGGKRIQIGDYLEYAWNPSSRTWASTPLAGTYHQDAGGAFLSWYDGSDHDATAHLLSNGILAGGTYVVQPQLLTTAGDPLKALTQLNLPLRSLNGAFVCANGAADSLVSSYCSSPNPLLNRVFSGSEIFPTISSGSSAFAPQGNFVLEAVSYRLNSINYAATYGASGQLMPVDAPRDTSVTVELWKVDTASGAVPQQLPIDDTGALSRNGLSVEWVAIDETGTQFVWQIGKWVNDENTGIVSCTQRAIEYRALPGNSLMPAGHLLRAAIPLPDTQYCSSFGPATFSPQKSPGALPTASSPTRQRRARRAGRHE